MIETVREYLEERPFVPFTIVTTGGSRYRVATPDHSSISPPPRRVIVWTDRGGAAIIAGLHVASLEKDDTEKESRTQ
jgi:hypothetical protein